MREEIANAEANWSVQHLSAATYNYIIAAHAVDSVYLTKSYNMYFACGAKMFLENVTGDLKAA